MAVPLCPTTFNYQKYNTLILLFNIYINNLLYKTINTFGLYTNSYGMCGLILFVLFTNALMFNL
jgi:hypothetical protein